MSDRTNVLLDVDFGAIPKAFKRAWAEQTWINGKIMAGILDQQVEDHVMGKTGWLTRLMAVTPQRLKLRRPEDIACAAFATELRVAALEGRLDCVFTHVANEIGYDEDPRARRKAQLAYSIAKALGFTTGTADYLFLWNGGSGAIEFKSAVGRQTAAQMDFEAWCKSAGVPYVVARSSAEGLGVLESWGVLRR